MSDQELNVEEGFEPNPEIIEAMKADGELATEEKPEAAEPEAVESTEPNESNEPSPFEFTVGGETKEYSAHEIKSALGRQRKLDATLKSDQYKLGTLMVAAKNGDASAQKKVQEMLVSMTGAEDADGMLEKLEEEKGEFDEDKEADKQAEEAEFEAMFEDVKDNVDYSENLAIINGSLKAKIPEALFEEMNSAPQSRRAMYNLVASGRMEHLLSAFEQHVSKLPHEKRQKVQTDAVAYGDEFLLVVQQDNARIAEAEKPSQPEKKEPVDDGLDAVSTAPNARVNKPSSKEPDFDNMSQAEFDAFRRKKGITV